MSDRGDAVADECLVTEGVQSTVAEHAPEGSDRVRGLGHIALLDWDGHVEPVDAADLLERHQVRGPTAVWESSEGCYHGWNLGVRRFPRTADLLADLNDDTGHRDVGLDRGWWRLRMGPKKRANNDVYKSAPEYLDTLEGYGGTVRVSGPHLDLAVWAGMPEERADAIAERHHVVGDTTKVVNYVTMTDREKAIRRKVTD
jgi:hypothetical protein